MPELPEVTIISEQLHALFRKKTIKSFIVHRTSKFKCRPLECMEEFLPLLIQEVGNIGKNIIFNLRAENGDMYCIVSHLRLTGHWVINNDPQKMVTPTFSDDSILYYANNDKIGDLDFVTMKEQKSMLSSIKFSVFDRIDADRFVNLCNERKRSSIYALIMSQKDVISGVGNYIANEALYVAGVNPRTKAGRLTNECLYEIYDAIVNICLKSYRHGGVSIRDYINVYSEKGSYQDYLKVYAQKCCPDGHLISREMFSGRTIHYCKVCQE